MKSKTCIFFIFLKYNNQCDYSKQICKNGKINLHYQQNKEKKKDKQKKYGRGRYGSFSEKERQKQKDCLEKLVIHIFLTIKKPKKIQ